MILFIAVPIEDEEDYEYLASCSDRLKRYASSGSFVRLANFHVTLIYLGETDRLEEVVALMDETLRGCDPFNLVLDRTGKFSQGKSTTVWVGGSSAKLTAIYETLFEALSDAGFDLEKRKYQPHITLGRKVVFSSGNNGRGKGGSGKDESRGRNAEKEARDLARRLAFENPPHVLPVRRIALFSSEVVDTKRVYRELHSVVLGDL